LPGWFLLLVALRDLVIVAGAIAWWRLAGPYDGRPTLLGKLTTFAQVLLVLACLLGRVGWLPWDDVAGPAILAVAFLTFASGLDYVIRYGVLAWRHTRKPAALTPPSRIPSATGAAGSVWPWRPAWACCCGCWRRSSRPSCSRPCWPGWAIRWWRASNAPAAAAPPRSSWCSA